MQATLRSVGPSVLLGAVFLGAVVGPAVAGGIDRNRLTYDVLFEEGRSIALSLGDVRPSVSGRYAGPLFGPFAGSGTGRMSPSFRTASLTFRDDLGDRLSYALILNTPYGADALYGSGPYATLSARWRSEQAVALLRYKVAPRISVYGGLNYVRSQASIDIPDTLVRGGIAQAAQAGSPTAGAVLAGSPPGSLRYGATSDHDGRLGYILGAAYEKPEIALRVGLTYESGVTHRFDSSESIGSPALASVFGALGTTTTRVEMPQSVTLDVQSGVAKDTLVFGSLRWSEWSKWEVRPAAYDAVFQSNITDFKDNVLTWQLGVGRKINDNFSVFVRGTYEKSEDHVMSRLAPTDGVKSIGLGGAFTRDGVKVTGGLEYARLGDTFDASGTQFRGNHAVGLGLTVGYRF